MNHYTDKTCCYCGSSLHLRSGRPHCSSDNLLVIKGVFDGILELEDSNQDLFQASMLNLRQDEYVFDLFTDYWGRKQKAPNTHIKCIHEDTYFRDECPGEPELPIPKGYIPFPDLIEVTIAEIMLDRELTGYEKDGSRYIPKINGETGALFFAALTWVIWPHSYIGLKDMSMHTDYTDPPLPVIFEVESIRGICSDRAGDEIDE